MEKQGKKTQPGANGVKHDSGKPPMSLLSNVALRKIAEVLEFGKQKYGAHNWRGGIEWSRVLDAAGRHLYAYANGEDKDAESGLSHLSHLGCCVMFLLEYEETRKDLDDRYKPTTEKPAQCTHVVYVKEGDVLKPGHHYLCHKCWTAIEYKS